MTSVANSIVFLVAGAGGRARKRKGLWRRGVELGVAVSYVRVDCRNELTETHAMASPERCTALAM